MEIRSPILLMRCFVLMKRRIYYSSNLNKKSIIDNCKGIEPVPMSYNVYDKRIGEKNIPLVIMHGLFGSKSNWNSLSKAINEKTCCKVITVDARNHGESPHSSDFSYNHLVEDINLLMRNLDISKTYLMGHSMGGRAAMLYSVMYPEKLEKLVVVDISPVSSSSKMSGMLKYFEAMRSVNINGIETLSEARKIANNQLSISIPELEVRQFLLTNLIKIKGGYNWRVNIDVLEDAFRDKIMHFPSITNCFEKPVLFIVGSKSDYVRTEDYTDILRIFPRARFVTIDAGHWLHAEKPNEFLQLVSTFINE